MAKPPMFHIVALNLLVLRVRDRAGMQRFYCDVPREVWPRYAADIERRVALPCGHYPNEQRPQGTLRELSGSLAARTVR